MNALLLYPEFPETFWSFKHALKFVRRKSAFPPLGLATVAALMPRSWAKRLVDLNVAPLRDEDLAWADMAFVSAMNVQRASARDLIRRCKAAGLRVVAGGPLFASETEQIGEADHFVLNEAELTFPPFLEDLQDGRAARFYKTSAYCDMTRSPAPQWEILNLRYYASMSIQHSRGCPFDCEFCNVTALFGHRPRIKNPRQIIAELDALYALGWRGPIFFVDDNFIGNKRKLKAELLPELIQWREGKRGIRFYTQASINLADDEELQTMMRQAGFDTVFIGIETPDEASLNECAKKQNQKRDLVADVKRIQRHGLQVQAGFIVGFDADTPSIFKRQFDFIQNSGIATAMVGLLQAPAGTRLYQRLAAEGRLLGEMSGDNADGWTNIIPAMDFETLSAGYRKIMRSIYSPHHYYERVKTFLREYQTPHFPDEIGRRQLAAFARSILHLGILGKERFHYWRLILWTVCHRPGLLNLAVTLSIYGHHFRRVCEQNGF